MGSKKLADCPDNIMRWVVPFASGKLEAKAGDVSTALTTAGEAAKLVIDVDKSQIAADGYDLSHIVVQLVDEAGNPVRTTEQEVAFEITGDAHLMGVDNGWNKSTQDFQSDKVETRLGRCLAIVQSLRNKSGEVTITASADGVESQSVTIQVK